MTAVKPLAEKEIIGLEVIMRIFIGVKHTQAGNCRKAVVKTIRKNVQIDLWNEL